MTSLESSVYPDQMASEKQADKDTLYFPSDCEPMLINGIIKNELAVKARNN